MIIYTVLSAIGLTLFGVILTLCTPAKYIDDTNQTYQDLSVATIVGFMLVGALFEELLFRGIIQNVLNVFIHNEWTSIFVASLIFIAIHAQYFKKPIMLVNLIVPSLTFGWIYFATNNLLVPFLVHYAMNVVITLLFKYRIIAMRK